MHAYLEAGPPVFNRTSSFVTAFWIVDFMHLTEVISFFVKIVSIFLGSASVYALELVIAQPTPGAFICMLMCF